MPTIPVTKRRIAVPANTSVHGPLPAPPHTVVLDTAVGPVTTLDKLKGYYKGLIALVTAVLVIANELTPVFNFLPGIDKQYITVAIAAVGSVLTLLKDNEHWVDDI